MKLSDKLLLMTVPPLAATLIRLLSLTVRHEILGLDYLKAVWARNERAIIAFWHDQLLLMVFAYPGNGAKLLISSSNDGELLARTMKFFSQDTVRGSSSKGGRAAFKQMLSLAKVDADIVLTPDGPKGPRHRLKDGVVQLARLSGRPIVPLAFVCSRGHRFGSWDRFLLPYPFSRGVYSYGEPLYFDKGENVNDFRVRLKDALQANLHCAEKHLESYGDSAV